MTRTMPVQTEPPICRLAIGFGAVRAVIFSLLVVAGPVAMADTLVLGRVSQDPARDIQRMQPLVDYVAARMADAGITAGQVLVARDREQLSQYLAEGKVDWVSETPALALSLSGEQHCRLLLQRRRDGVQRYHGVVAVLANSDIQSIDDLVGRRIAFEDKDSTSAYYLPAALLLEHGLPLRILATPRQSAPADAVAGIFSGGELNSAIWLERGLVDAAAFSNLDWTDPADVPVNYRQKFRILATTEAVPRSLQLVRNGLEQPVVERLKDILLTIHRDEQAQGALKAFSNTTGFDPIDDEDHALLEAFGEDMARLQEAVL